MRKMEISVLNCKVSLCIVFHSYQTCKLHGFCRLRLLLSVADGNRQADQDNRNNVLGLLLQLSPRGLLVIPPDRIPDYR